MNLLNKKKKEALSEEEIKKKQKESTANQWMPISDIEGKIVYRKDGFLVGMLRVQPENIDLLSDREKKSKVESLAEAFNGENEDLQIFCIGRPVDLNNYLEWLQDKAKMEQDFTRKHVLKGLIQQASQMAASGETIERRFYIIITKKQGNKAETELINHLNELKNKLTETELIVNVCSDDELMDVYSLFAHPVQASFERNELIREIPTILEY